MKAIEKFLERCAWIVAIGIIAALILLVVFYGPGVYYGWALASGSHNRYKSMVTEIGFYGKVTDPLKNPLADTSIEVRITGYTKKSPLHRTSGSNLDRQTYSILTDRNGRFFVSGKGFTIVLCRFRKEGFKIIGIPVPGGSADYWKFDYDPSLGEFHTPDEHLSDGFAVLPGATGSRALFRAPKS